MLKICLIDDKTYWIPQLINAIPKNIEYDFYYYNKISEIENIEFDYVFLDFYLDKDNKTALNIIDRFQGSIIIGFSSVQSKNDLIIQNWWMYWVEKLEGNYNEKLNKLCKKIL